MLKITIPEKEGYDDTRNLFLVLPERELQLEHSLVSLSKWESRWKKPFLSDKPHSTAETIDYIRHMTITQNVDESVYLRITQDIVDKVLAYIFDSMTATTFVDNEGKKSKEVITAEIIYYWMVKFNIPFECQKWHLNRLLTLIKVCSIRESPPKKMGRKSAAAKQRALNDARRAQLGTKG